MFKSILGLAAAATAAFSMASAATRTEKLVVVITDGDGAGLSFDGSLSFDDSLLPPDLSGGFTVSAAENGLEIDFPLINSIVVDETLDAAFPDFPIAVFDGDGALVDLVFEVLEPALYVEVLGDLSFFYEIGTIDMVEFAGNGFVLGGTAVPLPGAVFLFAPALGLLVRRRLQKR